MKNFFSEHFTWFHEISRIGHEVFNTPKKSMDFLAEEGFEPPTCRLWFYCSDQLNYPAKKLFDFIFAERGDKTLESLIFMGS